MLGNVVELKMDNNYVLDSDIVKLKVNSSNIDKMEYNRNLKELKILFNRGGLYLYKNVESGLIVDLVTRALNNGSVGKFFHEYIKQHECYKKV